MFTSYLSLVEFITIFLAYSLHVNVASSALSEINWTGAHSMIGMPIAMV